jgi:drug/metabolite transporter (DMT)-like permease
LSRKWANLLLLAAGAIWGMGFVAQSTAMASIGPLLFVGLRFACATAAILPFALVETARSQNRLRQTDWLSFSFAGLALFATLATQQFGLLTTTVTNSGFLTGLYVIFVPLLVVTIFRERPHWIVWPAVLTVTAGIWLLSDGGIERLKTGDLLTIACAVFAAMQVILIARFAKSARRPVTLAVTQFAVCSILGLCGAFLFEDVEMASIARAAPEILYAGIFSGGVAFTLQAIGQRYTTASQAVIFLSSEAVFAALFAAIILGERLPASGALGCSLILGAMLAVEIVPAMARRRKQVRPQV